MRLGPILVLLSLVALSAPASASLPWTCAYPPRAFACAGEYDMGDDAPGCGVTQYYVWVTSGTSSAVYGMSCDDGYRANGGGATAANSTAAGFRWQSGECLTVFVVEYISYQWTEVPVCAAGAPADVRWGQLGP